MSDKNTMNIRKNGIILLGSIIDLPDKTVVADSFENYVVITQEERTILNYFNGKHELYDIVEKTNFEFPKVKQIFEKLHSKKLASYTYEWNKVRFCANCQKYILHSSGRDKCPFCGQDLLYVPISSPYDPRPLTIEEKKILKESVKDVTSIKDFEDRIVLSNTHYDAWDKSYVWELLVNGLIIGKIRQPLRESRNTKLSFKKDIMNFGKIRHSDLLSNKKYRDFRDLPKFVYSENLPHLINESKDFIIKSFEKYGGDQPILVLFSGGKESVVMLDLALKLKDKYKIIIVFMDIGIEHPQTVSFISTIEKFYNVNVIKKTGCFWEEADKKGLPTINNRWCADYKYKLIKKICNNIYRNKPLIVLEGSRAYEEDIRRGYWRIHKDHRLSKNATVIHPLKYWTALEIWLYIVKNNLPINPLYYLGWERSVCYLCPGQSIVQKELLQKFTGSIFKNYEGG